MQLQGMLHRQGGGVLLLWLARPPGRVATIHCVDSAKLAVCHNARVRRNRVFRGLAQRGPHLYGLVLWL